jgi:hemerythrin-like domain-containing protein
MDPIEVLMNEHRLIESVLDSLEVYVDRLAPNASIETADLGRFTRFIRAFADTCHHGKEEDVLFETMVANGMPREAGPIAVMLHEHEEGRQLVRTLTAFAARSAEPGWSDADRQGIRQTAHAYAELLRQHIQKEDGILYPMAVSRLDPATMADIARRFDAFETEKTGPGEHEKLHALAEELIARYGHSGATEHHHHHCH